MVSTRTWEKEVDWTRGFRDLLSDVNLGSALRFSDACRVVIGSVPGKVGGHY